MLEIPKAAIPDGSATLPHAVAAPEERARRGPPRRTDQVADHSADHSADNWAARWTALRSTAFARGVRAALPAWIAARVLVCGISWSLYPRGPLEGVHGWDTKWYTAIETDGGYHFRNLVHFFPLTPLAARFATLALFLTPTSNTLIAFCWIVALLFGAAVYVLTLRETGDEAAARRAAWLTQLVPGGFALVMGYTEPLAGLLAAGYFLAVRRPSLRPLTPAGPGADSDAGSGMGTGMGLAAGPMARRSAVLAALAAPILGFLCGLARPTGAAVAIVGLAEGARAVRRAPDRTRAAVAVKALIATVAPVAGLGSWLLYCQIRFHGWKLPLEEQLNVHNRGAIMNDPLRTFATMMHANTRHQEVAYAAAVLILLAFALLLTLARRLPVSYIAWTTPLLILATGSNSFTSIARYIGELFPLAMAAAIIARRRWQAAAVLTASVVLLVVTTYQAFSGQTVA